MMVMRFKVHWYQSILLGLGLCCSAAPVSQAQSIFQSIFGDLLTSSPKRSASTLPRSRAYWQNGPYSSGGHYQSSSGGYYRTVCVRTCDGYYFPIRSSASRGHFRRDAAACESRCNGAQLYYLPKYSEDVERMLDLSGRRYDQLENAFVYRKKLINGCTCRPMPWSATERARHQRYIYQREFRRLVEEREKRLYAQMLLMERDREDMARKAQQQTKSAFVEPVRRALAQNETSEKTAAPATEQALQTPVANTSEAGFQFDDSRISAEISASAQELVLSARAHPNAKLMPKRSVKRRSKRLRKPKQAAAWPFFNWTGND